jgi:hypothetical protein
MRKYTRINVEDYDLTRVQDAIEEALGPISQSPILDANLIQNVVLTAGQDNQVAHGLSRPFRMWWVVDRNAQSDIWAIPNQTFTSRFLTLRCSADVTVSLWVA